MSAIVNVRSQILGSKASITGGGVFDYGSVPGLATPVLTITGGVSDTPLQPVLNTSAFTLVNGATDTHASTDWEIASDANFNTVVWSAIGSLSLTSITVGMALNQVTTYYARARHNGSTYTSAYSAGVQFTTLDVFVTTPSITSPADLATGVGETPTITSSAFAVTNGSDTHASSDWQIASDSGFSTIVVQSISDITNKTSWTVPSGNLVVSTTYYLRIRHTGTAEGASAYSPIISFTTAAAFGWGALNGATYDNASFNVSGETSNSVVYGLTFSSDGSRVYRGDGSTIYEYGLSTPWDISTAAFSFRQLNIGSTETAIDGIAISDDGSHLYVLGWTSDTIHQYALSIPFNINSASWVKSFSVGIYDTVPIGLAISSDGTKLIMGGNQSQKIWMFSLSTPFDISTASFYDNFQYGVGIQAVFMNNDGTKVYLANNSNKYLYAFDLSTPYLVSTAVYNGEFLPLTSQITGGTGEMFINPAGTKIYASTNQSPGTTFQYSL